MGSRGSSSGGVGKYGAGMKGGGDGVDSGAVVKSSHNLTEEIGKGGGKFVL